MLELPFAASCCALLQRLRWRWRAEAGINGYLSFVRVLAAHRSVGSPPGVASNTRMGEKRIRVGRRPCRIQTDHFLRWRAWPFAV